MKVSIDCSRINQYKTPILNAAAKYFPKTTLLAEQYFNNLQVLACCDAAAHYNFVQYLVVAESLYYLVVYLDGLLGAWRQLLLVILFTNHEQLPVYHILGDMLVLTAAQRGKGGGK